MKTKRLTPQAARTLIRSAFCGFALAVAAAVFPFTASCETLPENIMRLHVIANSNSPQDQAVKLKVRDAVLTEAAKYYTDAENLQQASAAICVHLQSIEAAANSVLCENGFAERAVVQVTDCWFSTRDYDDFSLPAGKYRTLRVVIGEGSGKNWWCVVFPALCLPAAEKSAPDVLSALTESEKAVISNPQKNRIKFKAVELYEQLKSRFDK